MRAAVCLVLGLLLSTVALSSCGEKAKLPVAAGMGSSPALPGPVKTPLPTVKIAKPVGWPDGVTPIPAAGLQVKPFASGLDHPRWLYQLPNGDVLVAETNGPVRSKESEGLKGKAAAIIMNSAGANSKSADRITLLRDSDGDGTAEYRSILLAGLHSPFGMALVGGRLYIANTDGIVSYLYVDGQTVITQPGRPLVALPGGPRNHHWTKSLVASPDGRTLFVGVGSNSNVGENGLDEERGRAAVWAINAATGTHRLFASGLRNPVGLAFEPISGKLWAAVNERDELGSDLVPDYFTSVSDGAFYGWPYSYYGNHIDSRVTPQRPDLVAKAVKPDYALGPHTASLGLSFATGQTLGPAYAEGAFIGQHGSWNRNPPSGYKVIFVPFTAGRPSGPAQDLLTGFLNRKGQAQGRPVGVILDRTGALLVADDVGNRIWRVSRKL